MTISRQTQDYILQHADDDVRQLALKGCRDAEVDLKWALQQIAGRQAARRKLPSWAATAGLVYPPHLNLEQCSSETAARYKAEVALAGSSFVDLTGGMGVDCWAIAEGFAQALYVERNELLCDMARHNFALLGCPCSVRCGTAEECLPALPHTDLIFLDPARRDSHGNRTYGISDCTPDVLQLMPQLTAKADRILVKLSPMLDWRKAVSDLQQAILRVEVPHAVTQVHIVSIGNECKELLILMEQLQSAPSLQVVCVNLTDHGRQTFCFTTSDAPRPLPAVPAAPRYLYEPHASIMKAGCFEAVAAAYGVAPIAPNSHLFLSAHPVPAFPGRSFKIVAVSSASLPKFNQILTEFSLPLKSANIAVRNFPLTADQLRRKLMLKDGGDIYIFATSLSSGAHSLFICRKAPTAVDL